MLLKSDDSKTNRSNILKKTTKTNIPPMPLKAMMAKPTKPNILSPMLPITAKGEKPGSEFEWKPSSSKNPIAYASNHGDDGEKPTTLKPG